MFFIINKIEQVAHPTDGLQNPKNPSNPMMLGIYRTQSRTALFNVYSKKAYGEYWDDVAHKKISRRLWTPDMKAFARHKVAEAPKPPYIFKLTIVGWIFIALIIVTFGLIIHQETKPPIPKSAAYVAMEQAPVVGDIYFGHYEKYKEKGTPVGAEIRFGWFKVTKVENNDYYLAPSAQMSKEHKPKEQLDHSDFDTEDLPVVQLTEQTGYNIRLKSADGLCEVYITDKK